ncbi:MAG TPA: hypothetical protein VJH22_05675 [Candidatus Nanoarchaeia archaeon]|nr:hypothetical protein [Candidatus Nanoarchaeia archaeon]
MERLEFETLSPQERQNYLDFHKTAYLDDLKHSEEVVLKFPRWSIISGYYAMHDVTKLFLATKFVIKMSSPDIHEKTILALREKIQDPAMKERLLKLLGDAKEAYFNIERLKEQVLPQLLRQGKQERGKTQYYTEDYSEAKKITSQKAIYFIDTFVKPYIKIIEGLME